MLYVRFLDFIYNLSAHPQCNFLRPPFFTSGSMKVASTPFNARLLTRPTRNCTFIFGGWRDRRWVHDVTRARRIDAGRITANGPWERNAWPKPFNRLVLFSRSLTTNKPAASPAPEPTNAAAKSSTSGDKDPDPLHQPLRNRLPRIAAVKKEGTEDDPEYYSELTVPVSFPGAPGGGAGGPGGAGLFSITRSPLFDAALTTFIGLTMGTIVEFAVSSYQC